jgi:hypothetical protein
MPTKLKSFLQLSAIWLGCVAFSYLLLLIFSEHTQCVTNRTCLNARDDTFLLALTYGTSLILLHLTFKFTMQFIRYAFARGWGIQLGAWTLIGVSLFGIVVLFLVTPSDQITQFIHIIVIAGLLAAFGVFMLYSITKGKKSKKKR